MKNFWSEKKYVHENRWFSSAGKSRAPLIDCVPGGIEKDPVIPRASCLELLVPEYPVPYLHCHVRGLGGPGGPAVKQSPI